MFININQIPCRCKHRKYFLSPEIFSETFLSINCRVLNVGVFISGCLKHPQKIVEAEKGTIIFMSVSLNHQSVNETHTRAVFNRNIYKSGGKVDCTHINNVSSGWGEDYWLLCCCWVACVNCSICEIVRAEKLLFSFLGVFNFLPLLMPKHFSSRFTAINPQNKNN